MRFPVRQTSWREAIRPVKVDVENKNKNMLIMNWYEQEDSLSLRDIMIWWTFALWAAGAEKFRNVTRQLVFLRIIFSFFLFCWACMHACLFRLERQEWRSLAPQPGFCFYFVLFSRAARNHGHQVQGKQAAAAVVVVAATTTFRFVGAHALSYQRESVTSHPASQPVRWKRRTVKTGVWQWRPTKVDQHQWRHSPADESICSFLFFISSYSYSYSSFKYGYLSAVTADWP